MVDVDKYRKTLAICPEDMATGVLNFVGQNVDKFVRNEELWKIYSKIFGAALGWR